MMLSLACRIVIAAYKIDYLAYRIIDLAYGDFFDFYNY
jgi:hypothetical protein